MRGAFCFLFACAAACHCQSKLASGAHPKPPISTTQCLPPGGQVARPCLTFAGAEPDITVDSLADELQGIVVLCAVSAGDFYWFFEPTYGELLELHLGEEADLPFLTKPDGTPLLTQFAGTDLDFILRLARAFTIGEVLSVTGGAADGWSAPMILELPETFEPQELFSRDPARFPAYNGDAVVAGLSYLSVTPEPASAILFLAAGAVFISSRASAGGGRRNR